tara:strand:- start:515 stop:868 length:354 start_codon:yes stop_codon:yes gene_type:complete
MIPYFECPFMNLEYANSVIAVRRLNLSRKGRQTLEYKQARKKAHEFREWANLNADKVVSWTKHSMSDEDWQEVAESSWKLVLEKEHECCQNEINFNESVDFDLEDSIINDIENIIGE